MGHSKPETTQGYYRLTHARRREAVTRLSRLQLSNTGSMVTAGMRALQPEEGLRAQVGSVAVPFGMCVEPINVQAGGHACPYRLRCLGCTHFRTDASYLPELQEYLTQLLISRERLQASTEVEEWVRATATPTPEEVDRVRYLIRRCEEQLDELDHQERTEIEACISVVRTGRAKVAAAIPLQLLGIVTHDEPDLFPRTVQRLASAAAQDRAHAGGQTTGVQTAGVQERRSVR
jgi:hypothetical protein